MAQVLSQDEVDALLSAVNEDGDDEVEAGFDSEYDEDDSSENTLLNQKWVIDQELTVNQAIENFNKKNSDNFEILDFFKFKVGEGIEVKKIDFSEEVKSLTK